VEVVTQAGPGPEVVVPRRGRERYRIAPGGGHRPAHLQGEPAEQAARAQEVVERRVAVAGVDLELPWRRHLARAPGPAVLTVTSGDGAADSTGGVIQVFQTVTPARRDQQRRVSRVIAVPLLFGLGLGGTLVATSLAGGAGPGPRPVR